MAKHTANLLDTFAVLKPDLRIETVDVSPGLYADLDSRFSGFEGHVLIAAHKFSENRQEPPGRGRGAGWPGVLSSCRLSAP